MQAEKTKRLVDIHVFQNQTHLVEGVLRTEECIFSHDDIKNYYNDEDDLPEIF